MEHLSHLQGTVNENAPKDSKLPRGRIEQDWRANVYKGPQSNACRHSRRSGHLLRIRSADFTLGNRAELPAQEQIPEAVIIFGIVLCIALLMFTTAIAMQRKKPTGRKLALWSAAVLIILFWPAGIYSWWFLHSDGAKQMYGVKDD